jgi:aminomethyltransferase
VGKQLVGFKMEATGIPRHGYALWAGADRVGVVTSGTQSPTLGVGIGLGYVPPVYAAVDARLEVEIRNRRAPARVVKPPFYRKG